MLDFRDQPWFHSMETEASGRVVVYVKYMDKEVLVGVPDTLDGKQVVVHFAGAKLAKREMFTNNPSMRPSFVSEVPVSMGCRVPHEICPACPVEEGDVDVSFLVEELERLEKRCGSTVLQDIFYEVHDGANSVTDQSSRFPEVKASLDKLYLQYGFDVIYNELDG
jgi:hypothetical protein